MAITKIMCMKSAERGNVAAHLKHSIAYICNEAKTENGSLVGGINCLPDFAYEQMIGTKEMFGQKKRAKPPRKPKRLTGNWICLAIVRLLLQLPFSATKQIPN